MNVFKLYPNDVSPVAEARDSVALHGKADHCAGLDLVRGLAALGVVLLHACVPYLRHPMPGLTWSVTDSTSEVADLAFWSIELFIMPVFLVIAGFLLTPTLIQRGPIGMLRTRWKRLARPLLFGVLVILPIDFYLWLCGWVAEGIIPLRKLRSLKFDGIVDRDLWGLSHLWFLLYLLTYTVVIAAGVLAVKRFSRLEKMLVTVQSPQVLMPILVAVAVLTLSLCPEVVWGFQHRFEPVPSKWLYSLTFFVAGMAWAKHDPRLQSLTRFSSPQMVAMAGIACFGAILMGRWHLEVSSPEGETRSARLLLAVLTVFAAWTIAVAGIAVAVARTRRVPESVQYLAGASFWLYIVHHPFLVLIHLDLKWLLPTVPGVVKVFLSFASAVALTLAFYEVGVRRTRFGRWTGLGESVSSAQNPVNDPALLKLSRGEAELAPLRRAA